MIRFLLPSITAVLLALAIVAHAVGQVPVANRNIIPKGASGHTVIVEDDWVECRQGMYPVRVTIETNPPIAAVNDERFTVSLHYSDYRSSNFVVAAPAMILAGNTSTMVELNVPAIRSNAVYLSQVLVEKGKYDGRLGRGDLLEGYLPDRDISYNSIPNLLLVSSSCPAAEGHEWVCYKRKQIDLGSTAVPTAGVPVTNAAKAIPSLDVRQLMYSGGVISQGSGVFSPGGGIATRSVILSSSELHEIRPDRLPQNWVGLLGVEQMLISMADLELVCSKSEVQRSNLEKWISVGGSLIVFDAGKGYRDADKVWSLLLGEQRALRMGRNRKNWRVPGADLPRVAKLFSGVDGSGVGDYNEYAYLDPTYWFGSHENAREAKKLKAWSEFKMPSQFPDGTRLGVSRYLNGLVVVVEDDMSGWGDNDWRVLHNSLTLADVASLPTRIGASTGLAPKREFGIPGVGKPPVIWFQILIGLFLLLTGPVMLIILKRIEQLQWMFVVVPVMSAVVCCSLFLFAILADGSKQWGRVQTVTTVDHRTDRATTFARAAYYSGRSPGSYQYADDTFALVASVESGSREACRSANGILAISGGDIRARTPHELSTLRSREMKERLVLIPSDPNEEPEVPPSIQNRLGSDVLVVVFRGHDGELYVVSDLKADQTLVGRKAPFSEMTTTVRQVMGRLAPRDIESYFSSDSNYSYSLYGRGYYNSNDGSSTGDVDRIVDSVRRDIDQAWLKRPGTYVAILEDFPVVSDQIEPVEYKLQIHVVRGQW